MNGCRKDFGPWIKIVECPMASHVILIGPYGGRGGGGHMITYIIYRIKIDILQFSFV